MKNATARFPSVDALTTRELFGIPVAAVTRGEALALIESAIVTRISLQIGVVNAAKIVNMARDERLRASVLSSDVVFADGMSVVWASRLLGRPLPERVAGIDLMLDILGKASHRVFLLGATQQVLDEVVVRIRRDFPGVNIVGSHHGYFEPHEEPNLASLIASSEADVLFVAMTSPKKEDFMARWNDVLRVPVCHGVGGSFDVLAGKVRRAPALWQKLGLEWLYRVAQEPGRLWRRYLVTNLLFCRMVYVELRKQRPAPTTGVPHAG